MGVSLRVIARASVDVLPVELGSFVPRASKIVGQKFDGLPTQAQLICDTDGVPVAWPERILYNLLQVVHGDKHASEHAREENCKCESSRCSSVLPIGDVKPVRPVHEGQNLDQHTEQGSQCNRCVVGLARPKMLQFAKEVMAVLVDTASLGRRHASCFHVLRGTL